MVSKVGDRKAYSHMDCAAYFAVLHWICFLAFASETFQFGFIENVSNKSKAEHGRKI